MDAYCKVSVCRDEKKGEIEERSVKSRPILGFEIGARLPSHGLE